MQQAADAGTGAVGSSMGLLPTTGINFDNTTAPKIAQQNYDAYSAMTAPQRAQQQNQENVTLSDRGIPIGSEVWNNEQGNIQRNNSIADTNAAAQAWNAAPGMQSVLTSNQIAQQNAPITQAGGELGLLSGVNSLAPQAPNVANVAPTNAAGAIQQSYADQMAAYNAKMGDYGNLAKTGLGLLTAPMTGGTSLAGNLFNSIA